MKHLLVDFNFIRGYLVTTTFYDTLGLGLQYGDETRIHLDRVKGKSHGTNEFEYKPDHLFTASATLVGLNANIVVEVKKLQRVLGLDEDHALALLYVLNDLAKFNKLIKIV